jgi:hypothetical protein
LMISAALLAGCTGDSPDDEPTTADAAPTTEAPPSPEPSPTEEPSEEPSLSPADEAASEATETLLAWFDYRNAVLQDPPPIAGEGQDADAAFDQLLEESGQLAGDEPQGFLVSAVGQYDQQGWRQTGIRTLEDVNVLEVTFESEASEEAAHVDLAYCLVPSDDFGVVETESGQAPPGAEQVEPSRIAAMARVELRAQEEGDPRWVVASTSEREGENC